MEPAEAWYFYYLPLKSSLYGFGAIKRKGVFVGVVSTLGYGVLFSLPQVLLCTIHFKVSVTRKEKEQRSGAIQQKGMGMFPKPRPF